MKSIYLNPEIKLNFVGTSSLKKQEILGWLKQDSLLRALSVTVEARSASALERTNEKLLLKLLNRLHLSNCHTDC